MVGFRAAATNGITRDMLLETSRAPCPPGKALDMLLETSRAPCPVGKIASLPFALRNSFIPTPPRSIVGSTDNFNKLASPPSDTHAGQFIPAAKSGLAPIADVNGSMATLSPRLKADMS